MAYFGADGIERENRQLKQQLAGKDAQLSLLLSEKQKHLSELSELRKVKQIAQEQGEEDAGRAIKAEKALELRELQQLRLQVSNLESSKQAAEDRLKKQEKETQQLQYELESVGMSGDSATQKLNEQCRVLRAKVADLEKALKAAEEEVKLSRSSVPPAAHLRGKRPRSSSVTTDNRVRDLEAEIETLRSAQGPADAQLDIVKEKLKVAQREQDKAVNARLALERTTKKEIEALRSRLDDAQGELDFYRRSEAGGSGGNDKELAKVKQAAESEKKALSATIVALEETLRTESDKSMRLAVEIEQLQRSTEQSTTSHDAAFEDGEVQQLRAQIRKLENEAISGSSVPSRASGDAALKRKLDRAERELRAAKEDLEASEALLEEKEKEIFSLKTCVPVPGSPRSTSVLPSLDDSRVGELEDQVAELQEALAAKAVVVHGLEAELASLKQELSAARASEASSQQNIVALQSRVEEIDAQLVDASTALQSARQELSTMQASHEETRAELTATSEALEGARAELRQSQEARDAALATQIALQARVDDLQSILSQRNHHDNEYASLEAQLAEGTTELAALRATVASAETAVKEAADKTATIGELRLHVSETEQRMVTMIADLQSRQEKLIDAEAQASSLQLRLDDAQDALRKEQQMCGEMQERWEQAAGEKIDLEERIDQLLVRIEELEGAATDRSTISEARERDVELERLQDQVDTLRKAREAEKGEYERMLESADFVRSQDAKEFAQKLSESQEAIEALKASSAKADEVQSKIDSLQASATARPQTPGGSTDVQHIGLLHAKIERLRKERDDLRQSISFAQHERHFAISAAEADRRSALEDLQNARIELDRKNVEVDRLRKDEAGVREQMDGVKSQLEAVNLSFATASDEKNDLMDRNAELQRQLQDVGSGEAQSELVAQLQYFNHEMAMLQTKLRVSGERLREVESDKAALEREIEELSANPAPRPLSTDPTTPADPPSASSSRHRRQSSVNSTIAVSTLTARISELEARLKRRDGALQILERKCRRAEAQLELSKDPEIAQELEGLIEDKAQLNAALERQTKDIAQLERDLGSARQAEIWSTSRLEEVEADLTRVAEERAVHEAELVQLVLALAMHKQAYRQVRGQWVDASRQWSKSNASIVTLERRLNQSEASATKITDLQNRATSLEGQLEEKVQRVRGLESEIETLLENLAETEKAHAQNVESMDLHHTQASGEKDSRILELEGNLREAEQQLSEASSALENATLRTGQQMEELENSLLKAKELNEENKRLGEELVDVQSQVAAREASESALRTQISDVKLEQNRHKEEQLRLESLVKDFQQNKEITDAEHGAVVERLQSEIRSLQNQLVEAQQAASASGERVNALMGELASLRTENEVLVQRLAEASASPTTVIDASAMADVQERIAELEASLTLKVQEVDEADDRVREVYKSNSKLEKKVAKLQRQLTAATTVNETALNTMANRSIPAPVAASAVLVPTAPTTPAAPISMPPPASIVPMAQQKAAAAVVTTTPRAPLRPLNNVFDPAVRSPIGQKRAREGEDEKPLPAEAIMLPPSNPPSARSTPRKAFTPKRGGAFSHSPAKSQSRPVSIFGPELSSIQPRRNIFSPE